MGWLENVVGKGENAGDQHFLFFPQGFLKAFFFRMVKSRDRALYRVNPLPDDKILDQTKLKAFADDKLNVTKIIISVLDRVENIVGKGEIAFTSNFSFSHYAFKRLLSQTCQKVSLCGNELTLYQKTKFWT